jgi:hypothetical protein
MARAQMESVCRHFSGIGEDLGFAFGLRLDWQKFDADSSKKRELPTFGGGFLE